MAAGRIASLSTRAKAALAAGAVLVLVLGAILVLRDPSTSGPTRLRERVVLTDETSSELTGAKVSIRGEQPILLDVEARGETCTFELLRPIYYVATVDGDTWIVIVRRFDTDLRTVNVRVDRVPDSGEPDGCREEQPSRDRGDG